ncbi:MAG: hypothetical protein EOO06_14910 [Chitinophagaceae bacterium]|nr:MAG: hypothetical protein EOO06_14910 [Chitinophagaceae bacterium]
MELDELKQAWNESNYRSANSDVVSHKLELDKKSKSYQSNLKKIIIPELIGSIMCIAAAIWIGLQFMEMDKLPLRAAAILSVILLLALPALSLSSTVRLNSLADLQASYKVNITRFAQKKIWFVKLQKINITLSYLLLVSIIVLLSGLTGKGELYYNKYFWICSFTVGYIFLLFYSRWVEKYYRNNLQQAEELLVDLLS